MSSQEYVVSGKDDFTVAELAAALKDTRTLVHANVYETFVSECNSSVATNSDWEKFWSAVNKVNAPVTPLIEAHEHNGAQPAASAGTVIKAISVAITIAEKLWNFFSGWDDKSGRSQWTQDLVRDAYNNDSSFNYVVCHTKHSINFNGVEDKDWSVRAYNYKLKIGSVGYKLYAFRSGIFSLKGDGGYLNWSFIGRVVSQDPDSKRPRNVVFRDV